MNLLKALLDSDIITDIDRKDEDEYGRTALINASSMATSPVYDFIGSWRR